MKMLDSDRGGILVTERWSVFMMFGYKQGGQIHNVMMQFLCQSEYRETLEKVLVSTTFAQSRLFLVKYPGRVSVSTINKLVCYSIQLKTRLL